MRKNLLLINPWIYDFAAYDLWSKPLGLLYIASFLRQHNYDISFLDCLDKYGFGWKPKIRKYGQGTFFREEVKKPEVLQNIPRKYCRYGIPEEAFLKRINQFPVPDAILITSGMTYWYMGPQHVVGLLRNIYPNVPIILGGIYATLLPDHAQKVIKPDHIITGPGEIKILQLLAEIFNTPIDNESIPKSIDDFPYPAFDLINHPDYLCLMTARGCPYDCSFCAQKQISMPFVQRSPEKVFNEIKYLHKKFKLRDFAFYDDALFINKTKHIETILQKVIESHFSLRFHSPNGLFAKYIDENLSKLMYQSNFKTIRLSFETSNEKRRKDMNLKVSNGDMIHAIENLEKAGFSRKNIEAYALIGLPGQTIDEVLSTMLFLNDLGVQIKLASYSPIPGTKDFYRAIESGKISPDIDPLLTNNTIFPLSDENLTYEKYTKIRTFSHVLNFAVQRNFRPFTDPDLNLRNVI